MKIESSNFLYSLILQGTSNCSLLNVLKGYDRIQIT